MALDGTSPNFTPRAPAQYDTRTKRALRLIAANVVKPGTVTSVVIALDTFAETGDTDLASHTMNQGSGWTHLSGSSGTTATVIGNNNRVDFSQNNHGNPMVWTTPTTEANVTITATVNIPSTGTNASTDAGPVFRVQDTSNYTLVTLGIAGSPVNGFAIYEQSAGTYTQRAYVALSLTADTDYVVQAKISGTTLTATLNGGNQITYGALVVNTSGTTHGMRYSGGSVFSVGSYKNPFQIAAP